MDGPCRSDCTAGQIDDGEAGRWTTRWNIGLPPLARVMGVGRQQQDVSTDYVQELRAARNSGGSGAMKEILHANVVCHQRTPYICWNARSLHIPALWMTFYSSTKLCVEQWKTAV